jgi:uncharacterized protein (TIGR02646 family)
MINKIEKTYSLTDDEEGYLNGIAVDERVRAWKNYTNVGIIKEKIKTQLNVIQNECCCYCGNDLWVTSRAEIEHIAPKKSRKKEYPEFTFEKFNLALACQYCNSSSKKAEEDTISVYNTDYSLCQFKLVHPYFDEPSLHYEWFNNKNKILIKGKTPKANYSINLFELQTEYQNKARGNKKILNRYIKNQELKDRFLRIITFGLKK